MAKYLDEAGLQHLVGKLGTLGNSNESRMTPFIVTVTISSTPDDVSSIWSKNVGPWTKVGKWKIATSYNTSNLKISGMYNDDFLKISVIESVNDSTSMKEYLSTWSIAIAREDGVEINEVSAYEFLAPMHADDGSMNGELYGLAKAFCISGNTKSGEKCMAINYQKFKGIRSSSVNILIDNKTKTTIKDVRLDLWICKKDMMQISS